MKRPAQWEAERVLSPSPVQSLRDYLAASGGRGLREALRMKPDEIVDRIGRSGLRGRGGAGFPVGTKWRTVAENGVTYGDRPVVVVNAAEGEPGTFKDRSIIRNNPYRVVEGALIAARAVGATRIVIASKADYAIEVARLNGAVSEMQVAGIVGHGLEVDVFEGPHEYLYGEESALLEAIDGRGPFPRVTPTFRVGLRGEENHSILGSGPALINNVESIANVPSILQRGSRWFRSIGTCESPGSVVCTVTGDVRHAGVAEVRLGTTLRQVLRFVGGGPVPGRPIKAVLPGVANPVITRDQFGVEVSYEGLGDIGAGMGSCGFIAFAEDTDMVAVAAGVARFLSVESCGQCSPCKLDGIDLAALLAKLANNAAGDHEFRQINRRLATVARGARCYLGTQQELVLSSLLAAFPDEFQGHVSCTLPPAEPIHIAELVDILDGRAIHDERHREKRPDWTFGTTESGHVPVEIRNRETRAGLRANG